MSDTESFESVASSYDNFTWIGRDGVKRAIDRLKAAHDREIAQARDPQRLRGTKPSTFDGAIEALREFRWQHATNDEDAIPYINAVKEMHDREIRDVSQREFARGMNAGQHSMDAEHRAIAMRLRALPIDGGSHENLSQIARAIWHNDFGWTQGACMWLRDELVRLMGGVSDDTCGAGCCCAAADSDGNCGLQREEVEHGGAAHDCADDSRGGAGGELVHMDGLVGYDVLDNERRKAIAELRKCDGGYTLEWDNIYEIFDALGVDYVGVTMAEVYENLCDRLIHLLGGDQPSGIDVLRAMDGESDTDGTCPNDVPMASITDELRKWMSTVLTSDDYAWAIADRIDERAKRDRESDRLRIEKLEQQRDELRLIIADVIEERDMWKTTADTNVNALLRMGSENVSLKAECERLRKRLDSITEAVERIKSL